MIRRTLSRFLPLALGLCLIACGGKDEPAETPGQGGTGGMLQQSGGAAYALAGAASVESAAPDELARLCPEGAIAFVRIRNLEELESEIAAIGRAIGMDVGSLGEQLGGMLGNPTLAGVDRKRPIGAAVFMGPAGPNPVIFLPVESKEAFQTGLESGGMWEYMKDQVGLEYIGSSWAAYAMEKSMVEGIALRDEPLELASRALMGDISVVVDMKTVYMMFGEQMEAMAEGMAEGMGAEAGMMPGADQAMASMKDGMMTAFADADYLTLAASLSQGAMTLGFRFAAKEGSETAELLSAGQTSARLLPRLGTDGFLAAEVNIPGAELWEMMKPSFAELEGMFPPELLAAVEEMVPLVDGEAVQVGYADGITISQVVGLTDGARFEAAMEAMMPRLKAMADAALEESGAPPEVVRLSMEEGLEHSGVPIRGMALSVDLGDDPSQEEPRQMMDFFLGGPSFEFYWARVGDHVVATMGASAKERAKALVDRMKADGDGPAGAAFDRATAGFPDQPSSVFFLDCGRLAQMFSKMPGDVMPAELRRMLAAPPRDLWLSGYYRVHSGSLDTGIRVSLKDFIEYGMPLFQMMDR